MISDIIILGLLRAVYHNDAGILGCNYFVLAANRWIHTIRRYLTGLPYEAWSGDEVMKCIIIFWYFGFTNNLYLA